MDKQIFKREDINDKILSGLDFIAKPVISTLSPRGSNVLIEMEDGTHLLTNDGVTIAKNISSKDQIEETVISIIKEASLRTNAEAGDGTTTTILLSRVLIKESLKLLNEGYSWIDIRNELNSFGEKLLKEIEKYKIEVKDDKGLKEIAITSANNDVEIAKYVMEAVSVAREDGMIFLEGNNKPGITEVVKDLGFLIKNGVMYQELLGGKSSVLFKDTPVLLTDKKLYYSEEAETILRSAVKAGYKSVVIVARDFMGEALNTLIANHIKDVIQVMLVKDVNITDKDNPTLYDLATYIGAKVFTEKSGSLVNKLTETDFTMVNQVFSDIGKTLFTPKTSGSKELKDRIKMLKEELEKDKENKDVKARLASLTTGVVTIRVGGHTPMEVREKVYRYEDAVNACRSAMRYGYLTGGGTSLLRAYTALQGHIGTSIYAPMFKKYCESIIRQIAINCGKHEETVIEKVKEGKGSFGYNALSDKYEDLLKAGIVDPFQVIKLAVLNSISVTNTIVSINHFVINNIEEHDQDNKDGRNSNKAKSSNRRGN